MKTSLRIAGAQIPVGVDIQRNKNEIIKALDWAKENEVDLLVTPEGSLSGYITSEWWEKLDELKDCLKQIEDHQKKHGDRHPERDVEGGGRYHLHVLDAHGDTQRR